MNYPDLIDVDRVYSCAKAAQSVIQENVSYPALREICHTYYALRKSLGSDNKEPFWESSLRPLHNYIRTNVNAPLTLNDNESIKFLDEFSELTSNSERTVPTYSNQINDLQNSLTYLKDDDTNPLYEKFEEVVKRENFEDPVGLVVPLPYIQRVKEFFYSQPFFNYQQNGRFEILTPKDLKELDCYKTLIVFGWTIYWKRHSLNIFDAPRAHQIFLITYDWLPNNLTRTNSFVEKTPVGGFQITLFTTGHEDSDQKGTIPTEISGFNEIFPRYSLSELRDRIPTDYGDEDFDNNETAVVNFVEFADSNGVFLNRYSLTNPEKPTKHLTIKLLASANSIVESQYLDDIEPGDFLLLRTEGGGVDFITPIADHKMGPLAAKCRETQKYWKRILKETIESKGIDKVVKDLEELDCNSANVANIRNWVNPNTIMMRSESDFEILISFLNLSEKFDEILKFSRVIRNTHRAVGIDVRKELKSQINKISLEELSSSSVREFTLDESESGSFTAFQINHVRREEIETYVSEIGKIVEME